MISPAFPLLALATGGCIHMLYTDARWFEINPYAAGVTGAAAIMFAGFTGPDALASSLVGTAALCCVVCAIRAFSTKSLGLGDYSLFAACGALVGIDAVLPFLILTSLFGMGSSFITGRLRPRKRMWSVFPMATAAVPAAFISTLARYHYGATFSKPLSWIAL